MSPAIAATSHVCADSTSSALAEEAVRGLLLGVGENIHREGLLDTPKRVAKAMREITEGHRQPLQGVLGSAFFHDEQVQQGGQSWVVVRDVEFASTSETTLLPFYGRCHIAYIPSDGLVLGLSKLARLTKLCAKRIQTQGAFAHSVLDTLNTAVHPLGAAVVVVATHMQLGDPPAEHVATAVAGCFEGSDNTLLEELLAVLGMDPSALGSVHVCNGKQQCAKPAQLCMASLCIEDGVAAPTTPDPSDQDTDMDSESMPSSEGDVKAMESAVKTLLRHCGEDPNRQGLQGSARRYVMSLLAATSGYHADALHFPGDHLPCPASPRVSASFPGSCCEDEDMEAGTAGASPDMGCEGGSSSSGYLQLVLPFCSLCEHHMLPFSGHVVVAYLKPGPGGRQLQRTQAEQLVSQFAQRLQIQERITQQVADAVTQATGSSGVAVMCSAVHMCMVARGVESSSSTTITTAVRGQLGAEPVLRKQIMSQMATAIRAVRS